MLVCLAVHCCSACVSTHIQYIYIYTRLYRRGEADDGGDASVAGAHSRLFLVVGGTKSTRAGAVKKSFRDVPTCIQMLCFFSRFAAG